MAGQQLCVSAGECRIPRGRSLAVGDRIMFRCEWWTVVGLFFAPRAQSVETMYILQSIQDSPTPERLGTQL